MLGHISYGSLLLTALIAILVFGTKRLRTIGEDLGAALRSFRKGLDGAANDEVPKDEEKAPSRIILPLREE